MKKVEKDCNEKYGYDSIFPSRLRSLMYNNKVTQDDLGESIGTTRQAISNYKDGKTQPNVEAITKLAQYFNVSADYLLGLSDTPTNDKDLKDVCDYTGLSEKVIENLVLEKDLRDFKAIYINYFLEHCVTHRFFDTFSFYVNSDKLNIAGNEDNKGFGLEYEMSDREIEKLLKIRSSKLQFNGARPKIGLAQSLDIFEKALALELQEKLKMIKEDIKKAIEKDSENNG